MPRPARLILHIGLPKTGTTAWQVWADRHRGDLLARGVDYPETASITHAPNHSAIQQSLMRRDMRLAQALLQRGKAGTMLLSAEGLSANLHLFPPDALAAFRTAVTGIDVVCVLVVREATAWLASMHRQALLNNANPRLGFGSAETVEAYAQRPHIRAMLDHDRLAADAVAAFGASRCTVVGYGPGAFAEACAVVGLDAAGLPPPDRINVSVSAVAAEVMRQVNATRADDAVRAAVRWLLQAAEPGTHNRMRLVGAPDAAAMAAAAQCLARLNPDGEDEHALLARLYEIAAQPRPET